MQIIIILCVSFLIFIITREFWLWFWRINFIVKDFGTIIDKLDNIIEILKNNTLQSEKSNIKE